MKARGRLIAGRGRLLHRVGHLRPRVTTSRMSRRAARPTKLDVINYAFGNVAPNADGNVACQLGDPWADYQNPGARTSPSMATETWPRPPRQFPAARGAEGALHPDLKVLISLGGWTWSKYFSDAALTEGVARAVVSSCIDLFIKGNLPDRLGAAWAVPAPRPASSTASTSTGSGRAPRATSATSSAPRTRRTSRCSSGGVPQATHAYGNADGQRTTC